MRKKKEKSNKNINIFLTNVDKLYIKDERMHITQSQAQQYICPHFI